LSVTGASVNDLDAFFFRVVAAVNAWTRNYRSMK
jgi:hypothetical protein